MKKIIYILLIVMLSMHVVSVGAYEQPWEISVTDYSGVIANSAKEYIKSKNENLFSQCEAKIIFVTVPTTDGADIDDFTASLYSEWKVAKLGRGNSVFFVIDTEKCEYSFYIGKNIRYVLTETDVYKYIVDCFEPYFSNKQYSKAVLSLYNAVGGWYEEKYNNVSLSLDDNIDKYTSGKSSKDLDISKDYFWVWIGLGAGVVLLLVGLKIKRSIQLRIRKMERRRLKRKFKIDIDKIVNS